MAGDLTEEEMAQRVAEAAEHGCPNDRHGQIRLIAGYQAGLGIGVTLRALQIILGASGCSWTNSAKSLD